MDQKTLVRVRSVIKDRAIWFGLIYKTFSQALTPEIIEEASRKAIYKFGTYKGELDQKQMGSQKFLDKFVKTGGAAIFDACIQPENGSTLNAVHYCGLVEGWKELGCTPEEIDLFCDIAMEGDRARAHWHGLSLELGDTIGKGCSRCSIRLIDPKSPSSIENTDTQSSDTEPSELMLVRNAVKDRGVWLVLLYREFSGFLPSDQVEALARQAIFEFGKIKGARDVQPFDHAQWVIRHKNKGSAEVFDSIVETFQDHSVQTMRFCPLMEAWQEFGCTEDEVKLFCDIAMDGDRGRASYHGLPMDLVETMPQGSCACRLIIRTKN